MILVLANRKDAAAAEIANRWQSLGARLVVPEMLPSLGFCYRSGAKGSPRAVADGALSSSTELRGVLVRMQAVMPSDVMHVRAEDREYVASEMTAFLVAWLSALPCAVLDRPTPLSLSGPLLRHEQWIHTAANAGVPVRAARRSTKRMAGKTREPDIGAVVTVVGDQCFGATTDVLAQRALAVARAAGSKLFVAYFEGPLDDPKLLHADSWVDFDDPAIEAAALSILTGEEPRAQEVVR